MVFWFSSCINSLLFNCIVCRYGPAGGGLLRLHSTYRHDLKIYSSDEGRVQMSAAAFTKGLLDLEGNSLTPILVSLVNKNASMLDAFGKVRLGRFVSGMVKRSWQKAINLMVEVEGGGG